MGIFSKKTYEFFTPEKKEQILAAIRAAEQKTSGEIRLYIESKNPYVNTLERAAEIFYKLEMDETKNRNGVLLYIAMKDHEVALFGDEGIYKALGQEYWNAEMKEMLSHFKENHLPEGIVNCIQHIGESLHKHFPFCSIEDKNELPDEIVFGK